MRNYTILHCHTDFSNGTTSIDSVTKYTDYIKRAKELGMKSISFSEHGNVFQWIFKKKKANESGLKYIHSVELYVTESLKGKKRDNYHVLLIARNWEGAKELNKLLSNAYNREDGHFYYTPRITFDELMNTSDNIIIATACIGGILGKGHINIKNKYLDFLSKNNHRCFLEVQHHQDIQQVNYNKEMIKYSEKYNIRLLATTDTHALDEKHAKGRRILQRSKNVFFEDEEGWDITLKTYDELVDCFRKQNIFTEEQILEMIENTNVVADMVEDFEFNREYKYPKLFDNPEQVIKQKIMNGIKEKGIDKYPNYEEYLERIRLELKAYDFNKAYDFLLLDEDVKSAARKEGIYCGPARGSVSGSIVAYIIGLTEVDSIKNNLNFERFMNLERVAPADIDSDWPPTQRDWVKNYLHTHDKIDMAEIITFNTVALKGSIRDCGRALGYELSLINEICNNIEEKEIFYRDMYKELFEYVDIINGTIVSIGVHPCGCVTSPIALDENISTITLGTTKYPVSAIMTKEVDELFYTKLDVLSLDNVELINETCKMAGIERLNPDNVPNDEEVWKSMRDNTVGIFQWESDLASKYIEKLFSDETVDKIKKINPNFQYIDLLDVGNGALRPAGSSYRDKLATGEFKDNGHKALNDFLAPTLGYLVYQEQIIEFLNTFCGYTKGEADMVRRGFAKKLGTDEFIPKIKSSFIETMINKFDTTKEDAEKIIEDFLVVIQDASDYLFSLNHARAYSFIGYMGAYLRYYYPLEYLTSMLNLNNGNLEKTKKIIDYAKTRGINIERPTYGKSRAAYFFDKETNTIYKGIKSVKYLNEDVAEELYKISQEKKYNNFIDLISENKIQSRHLEVLIKLGYFREFGSSKKLLFALKELLPLFKKKQFKKGQFEYENLLEKYSETKTDKVYKDINMVGLCNELFEQYPSEEFSIETLIGFELEYTGDVSIMNPSVDNRECVVLDVNTKYTPILKLYKIRTGEVVEVRTSKQFYNEKPVKKGDKLYVSHIERKFRKKLIDGKWVTLNECYYIIQYFKL